LKLILLIRYDKVRYLHAFKSYSVRYQERKNKEKLKTYIRFAEKKRSGNKSVEAVCLKCQGHVTLSHW